MAKRKLLIRDLTLRDGQQSQFATRMNQNQVDRVLPYFKEATFYAMEVWGGAVPDSVMRFLNENPWERLEKIKEGIGPNTKLTALSRGRNLFGYNPYPDSVIEGFCRNAIKSGIDMMRVFDALNDIDNYKSTIKFVKENKGTVDGAVCYTTDPKFSFGERLKSIFSSEKLPPKIFTVDYFVKKAKELETLGANMVTIKDMAGLIDPEMSAKVIKALKKELNIPVDLHTHCTPGYGLASILMAIINGADMVDTVIYNFAGGPAAPAFELVKIFADKMGIEIDVNLDAVVKINKELKNICEELKPFNTEYLYPREFDITKDKLPTEIEKLFDNSIKYAETNNYSKLLDEIHKIEDYFGFPKPNEIVKHAQIPGGMYTNMRSQLEQAKMINLMERVLHAVPKVRLDSGIPPLVTPTSQIVGVQAVNCIIDENNGKPWYTTKSAQFVNLVKGSYGKTPYKIDPEFRYKIAGTREEIPYDVSKYEKQPNPVLEEFGGVLLAQNEKEELLLELFPHVANNFLKKVREKEFNEKIKNDPEYLKKLKEKNKIDDGIDDDLWDNLSYNI
ncbi:MAG: carboxylase [bacterium]|uniref:Pyruvate carboxyltransferase domain-containing protein n=2 Tax=Bacteria candidate phyla TaxID=1783234 RepID=A0A101HYS5_UNCT6|nr:MAG: hypothetical protein XD76_1763 [candidate division TA06 bacterium 32_111]KUK85578.1 MAG: hypothetical protein XE03_1984 [candidate division TA06 bacterium 34_109]MDI6701115.1 carboxylase [bacterium]HAF07622.1 carboxylase [candidate division WOR-3 bacterium]HCP15982.1 carboxylase [candidate division WOR-3 bacterium]